MDRFNSAVAERRRRCRDGKGVPELLKLLDSYVAGLNDEIEPLHDWLWGGDAPSRHGRGSTLSSSRKEVLDKVLDEIQIHLIPVPLGEGRRLFDHLGAECVDVERTRVVESTEGVTHLRFRVKR